jgi:nucleobase:cation symporter-1, NCS1 family
LIPIPRDRRTWTWQGFAGYWVIGGQLHRSDSNRSRFSLVSPGINTTSWTIGSSLLALGLSVGQAMGMVVCAAVIIGFLAVGAGWMGSHQHLGFTVVSRRSVWCRIRAILHLT